MKKFAAVIAFFLMATTLFAQDINKTDANGKRHGLWKGTYEKSNRPRYAGTFEHGRETGTFKFFEDDKASTLAATREFAKDGSCYTIFYDAAGRKVSEGKEVNKLREGEWKIYQPGTTSLIATEPYAKGKLNGVKKIYFPSGTIAEETTYVNGVKEGPYKKYTEKKAVLLEESVYKNDELHGPATFRNAQGQVVSQGTYANNKKTGNWKYFQNGKLAKQEDETNKKIQLARKERKN